MDVPVWAWPILAFLAVMFVFGWKPAARKHRNALFWLGNGVLAPMLFSAIFFGRLTWGAALFSAIPLLVFVGFVVGEGPETFLAWEPVARLASRK